MIPLAVTASGTTVVHLAFIVGVPVTVAFLHFLLYVFDRRSTQNLWVSLIAGAFAGMALYEFDLVPDRVNWILVPAMLLSILAFVYSVFLPKRPKQFRWFVAFAIAISALGLFEPDWAHRWGQFFILAGIIETFRVSIMRWNGRPSGSLLPAAGMFVFGLSGLLDVLIDLDVIDSVFGASNPYLYGGSFMVLSMSVHLAHSYTRMNADLERQLGRVRELIDQMLAHERAAREEEVRRRLVEADNERKTKELQQARDLQLSMIPRDIPSVPDWHLAASMEIATEVGGDYYDFHVGNDGSLTVAIGDAVGHGMRAGIIVAATKSLFATIREDETVADALTRFDDVLRSMRLRRAHMCLLIARFSGDRVEIANAGMPPPLLRRVNGHVSELPGYGLPLGARSATRRSAHAHALDPGDLIVLMSDGLPESRGEDALEILGYEQIARILRESADSAPATITQVMRASAAAHLGDGSASDDMTIVAIRRA